MKKAMRILAVFAVLCLMLSASMTSLAAERSKYTYTVTISAGNQGTLSTADGVSISVDGGGDYKITTEDGGKLVKITGLTAANHVRFLNSAASVAEDSKYYVKGIRMGGHDDSLDLAYFPVERDQDYVVAYGIRGRMVKYTVNYEDAAGNRLYPSQVYYGNVGDSPVIAYLYVEGYQPQAYNLTRTLQSDSSRNVFTFIYTPIVTIVPGTAGGGTAAQEPNVGTAGQGGGTGTAADGEVGQTGLAENEEQPEEVVDNEMSAAEIEDNQGEPQEIINLDDEETPLANFNPESDSTVAGANSRMWKYTWIAVGIGILSLIALLTGFYLYRKMRKAGSAGTENKEDNSTEKHL